MKCHGCTAPCAASISTAHPARFGLTLICPIRSRQAWRDVTAKLAATGADCTATARLRSPTAAVFHSTHGISLSLKPDRANMRTTVLITALVALAPCATAESPSAATLGVSLCRLTGSW